MNSNGGKLLDIEAKIKSPLLRASYHLVKCPVENLLGIDEVNRLNGIYFERRNKEYRDLNFFDAALKTLNATYKVDPEDLKRIPKSGPIICVANHPYGGIDGIIMGSILASARPDTKLLVNFMLNAFEDIRDWTIEVNPFGSRNAAAMNTGPLKATLKWLKEGHCLGTFPAGVVSHFHPKQGIVTDPPWKRSQGSIIQKSGATVVPIYFEGRNSFLFQTLGLFHPRLRTIALIKQLVNKQGRTFKVRIGKPISPKRLERFDSPESLTQFVRANTYILEKRDASDPPSDKHHIESPATTGQPIAERQPVELLLGDIERLPANALLVRKEPFSIYGASSEQIPHILEEIGRTREETFRPVGEGTGKPLDLDRYDEIYHHLFMWNDEAQELVGAYRYCFVDKTIGAHGVEGLYCNTLYEFKKALLSELNPAIEVGRSYVTPKYQRKSAALALIWRGIGELVSRNPEYRTLFGAVSMTDSYRALSKSLMVEYLTNHKLHPILNKLISARVKPRLRKIKNLAHIALGTALPDVDDISSLVSEVEKDNKGVPTLLKHYLKLNGVILCFGIDQAFSDALDGFIVVDLLKTDERHLRRYMGNEGYERFAAKHQKSRGQLAV